MSEDTECKQIYQVKVSRPLFSVLSRLFQKTRNEMPTADAVMQLGTQPETIRF